ncbi:hypothetical protein K6959_10365 [Bacillus aquiflavi]|nr:hypothetical protein K6959_10365 [Bacillus aquiflavi]
MGKLIVHTEEIAAYLKKMYRHYEQQAETIESQLAVLREASHLLAPEDLAAVEYEMDTVKQKGNEFITEKMPSLEQTLSTAKPIDPYLEAISNINAFLSKHNIPEFNQMIRTIQPVNRTTQVSEGITLKGFLQGTGEVIGVNDLYRAFNGKDPFTGKKLSFPEWLEAVGWTVLTVAPPSWFIRTGRAGKAAKGMLAFQNSTRIQARKKKLAQVSEMSKLSLRTVKDTGKQITQKELERIRQFIDTYSPFIGNRLMPAYATGVVGTRGVRLAEEQIYRISGGKVSGGVGGTGKKTSGAMADVSEELTRAQKRNVEALNNVIANNLKDHDFSGTLRDLQGNPVPKPSGGFWDHKTEMI